ncbi:hypothetical protein K2X33_07650 [bacterium]|nr:hypothetical protein [bacterium]
MNVFLRYCALVLALGTSVPAAARAKPPMMPPRIVQAETPTTSVRARRQERSPFRLGVSGGAILAGPSLDTPMSNPEIFAGARVFSRFWLGGRWYLIPGIGYYKQVGNYSLSTQATNILELSASLQYALLRLGPVGILMGVSNQLTWRFTADGGGLAGLWTYRLGPVVSANIHLSPGLSLVVSSEFDIALYRPHAPNWVNQAGFVFGF